MAEIIAFPLDRYVGKARHVAALIARRRGKDRDTYFRTTCHRLAAGLRGIGLDEREVQRQIEAFVGAVNQAVQEGWRYPADQPIRTIPADGPDLFFRDDHHPPGAA